MCNLTIMETLFYTRHIQEHMTSAHQSSPTTNHHVTNRDQHQCTVSAHLGVIFTSHPSFALLSVVLSLPLVSPGFFGFRFFFTGGEPVNANNCGTYGNADDGEGDEDDVMDEVLEDVEEDALLGGDGEGVGKEARS